MICGSAIAAYINMHNCCVLIEKGLGDILKVSKNTDISKGIKQIKNIYKDLPVWFNDIRDNLGGHPEGSRPGTDIATKRTMISSDGRVKIGRFLLHSRKDLEKLREFLERIGQLLNQEWKIYVIWIGYSIRFFNDYVIYYVNPESSRRSSTEGSE